eukprot:957300-Prymnesium_polylepis.1
MPPSTWRQRNTREFTSAGKVLSRDSARRGRRGGLGGQGSAWLLSRDFAFFSPYTTHRSVCPWPMADVVARGGIGRLR